MSLQTTMARSIPEPSACQRASPRPLPVAQAQDPLRARNAWFANTRQELVAPVAALLEVAGLLADDARESGPEDFLADLEKIHASASTLLDRVNDLLAPTQPGRAGADRGE